MTVDEIIEADNHDKRFRIEGYSGIAWYFLEAETEVKIEQHEDEDGYWEEWDYDSPTGMVIMVMVGDDRRFTIDPDDVSTLEEDEYCPECGQIGCTAWQ